MTPDPRYEILKRLHDLRLADYSQLGTFPGIPLVDVRAVLKTLVKEGYVDDRRSSRGPFSLTHAGVDYYYTLARSQQAEKPVEPSGNPQRNKKRHTKISFKKFKECIEFVGIVAALLVALITLVQFL